MVSLLLGHGADLHAESTATGRISTALTVAAGAGMLEIVQRLAVYGALCTCCFQPVYRAHDTVNDWLHSRKGTGRTLEIAVACRLVDDAKAALRIGRMDPSDVTLAEVMASRTAPPTRCGTGRQLGVR